MGIFDEQLHQIQRKLQTVREMDPECKKSLGASHRYLLGKPLQEKDIREFELEYKISLPEDYRTFLLNIGHGGINPDDDTVHAAGPDYGLYSLPKIRMSLNNPEAIEELSRQCRLFPYMDEDQWHELTKDCSPFDGMIAIGTRGCTFDNMLVLNGEYCGKVVYVDIDCNTPPVFSFEKNFLDWYETWLDEMIAGYRVGMSIRGDEQFLIQLYRQSSEKMLKNEIITSFYKFPALNSDSIDFLDSLCQTESIFQKKTVLQVLTNFDYPRAKPHLTAAIAASEQERLAAFQAIVWYAKEYYNDWENTILGILPKIDNDETLTFASYILEGKPSFLKTLLAISNPSTVIRARLITEIGNEKTRNPQYVQLLVDALNDQSEHIVFAALRAVWLKKEPVFLPCFEKLMDRFMNQYIQRKQEQPNDIRAYQSERGVKQVSVG